MWPTLGLRHGDFGDQRLNRRLVKSVDDLVDRPQTGGPLAWGDWAATKAADRSRDDPRIDPDGSRPASTLASSRLSSSQVRKVPRKHAI